MEHNIEVLARQRVELKAQADAIADRIAAIDAQIIDAVEVGGVVTIGDQPAWKVQQRRTFDLEMARSLVPESLIDAATVTTTTVDAKVLQTLIAPAIRDACMKAGKTFVVVAK
jgi:hypothetical protein